MDHDKIEHNVYARSPRTLPDGGMMVAGETAIVETDRIITAYIPASAQSGQVFRLLNTSDHDVVIRVEWDAFQLEMVNSDPEPFVTIRPATMFFGVAGWSNMHNAQQVFACITSDQNGGGPGPDGDWLPVENPTFTGKLGGPTIEMGTKSPTWGAEPTDTGYFLLDPADAGLTLETDGDADIYSRYGRWQTQGDLFVTAEGGPLTLRSFNGHAQLIGGNRVGVSSGGNRLSFSRDDMAIYGNLLKMGYYNYSTGDFERYIQADATGVTTTGDINTRLVVAPRRIDVIAGDSVELVGGDLGNAPRVQLGNDIVRITAEAGGDTATLEVGNGAITVGDYPKVTRVLPLASLANDQLVTKEHLAGAGIVGDYLPKDDPTFTGTLTGGNADVLLLGVRGNIAVGADDVGTHLLIEPGGVSISGHMGESHVDLSSTDFTAGGLNSITLQSRNVLIEGNNYTLRAVAGEDGPGDLDLRAARNVTIGALNGNVVAATRSFAIAPTPTEDLIASFDNTLIVMGDPSTSAPDNPKFNVWGESQFATNPVLAGTVAAGELPGMALITKDQVFDVLNGDAYLKPGPTDGVIQPEHFGKTLKAGPTLTLPVLANGTNGIVNVVSDTDVSLKLVDGHPGMLYDKGVNRGPGVTLTRGTVTRLVHIDGNWFAS